MVSIEYDEETGEPKDPNVRAVGDILYQAIGGNWEIGFQGGYWDAGQAVLDSDWLRLLLADAYDAGVSRAGRYGHEDSWDNEVNPHIENPWRTTEELIEEGWSVEYRD